MLLNRWVGTWLDGDLTGQLNIQGGMMAAGKVCVQWGGGNGVCAEVQTIYWEQGNRKAARYRMMLCKIWSFLAFGNICGDGSGNSGIGCHGALHQV